MLQTVTWCSPTARTFWCYGMKNTTTDNASFSQLFRYGVCHDKLPSFDGYMVFIHFWRELKFTMHPNHSVQTCINSKYSIQKFIYKKTIQGARYFHKQMHWSPMLCTPLIHITYVRVHPWVYVKVTITIELSKCFPSYVTCKKLVDYKFWRCAT